MEEPEYIILRKPEVFVYRIPPRALDGHRAEDWKESIWKGRLLVIGKEEVCIIRLLESNSDSLFANSIVSKDIETSVERAVDSSRYFCLRLDDGQGRHAYIGIGFSNRNDAFDFIYAVNNFHQTRASPSEPVSVPKDSRSLALDEGQHVKIRLKNLPTKSRRAPSSSSLLPPPPITPSRRSLKKGTRREVDGVNEHEKEILEIPSTEVKKDRDGISENQKKTNENYEAFRDEFGRSWESSEAKNGSIHENISRLMPDLLEEDDKAMKPLSFGTPKKEGEKLAVKDGTKQTDTIWDAFSDEALQNWYTSSNVSEQEIEQKQELSKNPFAEANEKYSDE